MECYFTGIRRGANEAVAPGPPYNKYRIHRFFETSSLQSGKKVSIFNYRKKKNKTKHGTVITQICCYW
jgi:hypothetical protein